MSDDRDDRPPNVFDYVSEDAIQDLWSIGYTVIKRPGGDPFHVPAEMLPHGRRYQWWHLVHDRAHFQRKDGVQPSGWAPVPASRHDGYFMPFGHIGDIEVGGLGLFEKSKFEVDQELASNVAAARKQVDDWVVKTGANFSGNVTVGDVTETVGEEARDIFAISKSKTIETRVRLPEDMIPHMAAIFEERDRLKDEMVNADRSLKPGVAADKFYAAMDADPAAPWWPTLHAILLPTAIENVRAKLRKENK